MSYLRTHDRRIRGSKGVKRRHRQLDIEPLCRHCSNAGIDGPCAHGNRPHPVRGTAVDHIIPLHKGGKQEPENEQTLCDDCHAVKTRADLGHRERPLIGADGYAVNAPEVAHNRDRDLNFRGPQSVSRASKKNPDPRPPGLARRDDASAPTFRGVL